MSDALDQSRGELNRQWDKHIGGLFGRAQYITNAVEALVNAILDAREAKAEPDPRDTYYKLMTRAQEDAGEFLLRAEAAEAALAELRGRLGELRNVLTYKNAPSSVGPDSANKLALTIVNELLTDPEAKEGGGPDTERSRGDIAQPARDTGPVPATDAPAWDEKRLRELAKQRGWYTREGTSTPDIVNGGWKHPFSVTVGSRELIELLNAARAAGITGKGTGDE